MWLQVVKGGLEMFFIGRFEHNLDDKSRLMIPTKLRENLNGKLYMTLGVGKCIELYPEETYLNRIAINRNRVNNLSKEGLGFNRVLFSYSTECKLDGQGRVLLTKEIRKVTSVDKEVIIIGNDDHIEIWNKFRYEQMELEYLENFDSNAEIISTYSNRGDE